MIRALALLIIVAFLAAAVIASNRDKPMLIDQHSPGPWDFHNAGVPRTPGRPVIPFLLNTQCVPTSRNAPRWKEREA